MKKKTGVLLVLSLLAGAMLAACDSPAPAYSPTSLGQTEVREYQGEKLSSINAFRENSIQGPQYISQEGYKLKITGLVEKPLSLTYDEVLARQSYNKVVTLYCVEGWEAAILWEGVVIEDLLNEAGVKDGAVVVIFHAEDGYTSSLTLDYVRENDILLAYKMNGVTLPPERGFPFQVVAESKWGYKWVKWVTEIELSDDAEYRGTWEGVGYNNDGDVEGPKFERSR